MPKSKNQHLRFRIIDRELHRYGFVKSSQLVKRISEELIEDVDIRTIQGDITAMKNDTRLGFYAPIEYDKSKKAHYYTDKTYSITGFSLAETEITALKFYASCLQLYSSAGLFKDFSSAIEKVISGISIKNKLKNRTNPELIIQTDTIQYSSTSGLFEKIVPAIDEKINISFKYQKFHTNEKGNERIISPYLLKEFKNRWYVLGLSISENKIKTFALDRITDLKHTGEQYIKSPTFDPAKYFKHSFGITTPSAKIQVVKLQFSKQQIPYVKSLSIHPTQVIIKETADFITVTIEVIPSYELYEYILGKIPHIKVISPRTIANHVSNLLKEGLQVIQ